MEMTAVSNLKPANFGTQSDMGKLRILLGLNGIIQLNALELVQMIPATPGTAFRSHPNVFWLIFLYGIPKPLTACKCCQVSVLLGEPESFKTHSLNCFGQRTVLIGINL